MASLAELLLEDFGSELPISHGNAKLDDPLVITSTVDYISVEHEVARHIFAMMREEYALAEQRVHHTDGRVVDELVFDAKPSGASNGQAAGASSSTSQPDFETRR